MGVAALATRIFHTPLLPPEIFNEKDCPHDDLWPCKEAEVESARALFGSPSEAPQGSPPRLQWSALEWKSAPLTPTPFATSSIDPNRDLAVGRDDEAPLQRGATGQADRNGSTASASHAASDANDGATLGRGQTIMAERAESCAHACEKIGLRCSLVGLRELNSCDAVRRHLQCLKGSQQAATTKTAVHPVVARVRSAVECGYLKPSRKQLAAEHHIKAVKDRLFYRGRRLYPVPQKTFGQ
eukprot:scaffold319629_cov36-Tisochrysis_lutea.AAC.1